LLLAAVIARAVRGEFVPTEIVMIERDGRPAARWFAGGRLHERFLADWEAARIDGDESATAYVGVRDPARMRLDERSPGIRACRLLARLLVLIGVVGFALSWLPLLVA